MRNRSRKHGLATAVAIVTTLAAPSAAMAYVGPGAGLSIVGTVLAFVAAIVAGILGFLWFPIRRLIRKRKEAAAKAADSAGTGKTTIKP